MKDISLLKQSRFQLIPQAATAELKEKNGVIFIGNMLKG